MIADQVKINVSKLIEDQPLKKMIIAYVDQDHISFLTKAMSGIALGV
jgi:hypothetical protein